jgi:pyruvate/2-oxoglutarate dehydrogenase complex dihydrolipoamide dehydrogenase (E3) component
MLDQDFDLVVIGSGPAGQKGAINAAKQGKRVAVVERDGMVGGASVHSGTIPSKTLRRAIFHTETLTLLGIHAIGQRATEIIHIGQAVLAFGGTIEYFRDAVFNYPTLAEAYKVAALNGLNKL